MIEATPDEISGMYSPYSSSVAADTAPATPAPQPSAITKIGQWLSQGGLYNAAGNLVKNVPVVGSTLNAAMQAPAMASKNLWGKIEGNAPTPEDITQYQEAEKAGYGAAAPYVTAYQSGASANNLPEVPLSPDANIWEKGGQQVAKFAGMFSPLGAFSKVAAPVSGALESAAGGVVNKALSSYAGNTATNAIKNLLAKTAGGAAKEVLPMVMYEAAHYPNQGETVAGNALSGAEMGAGFGAAGGALGSIAGGLSPVLASALVKAKAGTALSDAEKSAMAAYGDILPVVIGGGMGLTEPAQDWNERLQHAALGAGTFAASHALSQIPSARISDLWGAKPPEATVTPTATPTPPEGQPTTDVNVNWGASNTPKQSEYQRLLGYGGQQFTTQGEPYQGQLPNRIGYEPAQEPIVTPYEGQKQIGTDRTVIQQGNTPTPEPESLEAKYARGIAALNNMPDDDFKALLKGQGLPDTMSKVQFLDYIQSNIPPEHMAVMSKIRGQEALPNESTPILQIGYPTPNEPGVEIPTATKINSEKGAGVEPQAAKPIVKTPEVIAKLKALGYDDNDINKMWNSEAQYNVAGNVPKSMQKDKSANTVEKEPLDDETFLPRTGYKQEMTPEQLAEMESNL
ncbi:MAG: hypothetical protein HQK98_09615, partial [Nitrospirae bacterium]|nr:hypothetical protein [Nitrospirota bacterium]